MTKPSPKSAGSESAYRLGERHTGDGSVEDSHPNDMESVEAHGVPHTNMGGQQLSRQTAKMNSHTPTLHIFFSSKIFNLSYKF